MERRAVPEAVNPGVNPGADDLELLALDRLPQSAGGAGRTGTFVFSDSSCLDHLGCSGAFSRLRFLRLRLRAKADFTHGNSNHAGPKQEEPDQAAGCLRQPPRGCSRAPSAPATLHSSRAVSDALSGTESATLRSVCTPTGNCTSGFRPKRLI